MTESSGENAEAASQFEKICTALKAHDFKAAVSLVAALLPAIAKQREEPDPSWMVGLRRARLLIEGRRWEAVGTALQRTLARASADFEKYRVHDELTNYEKFVGHHHQALANAQATLEIAGRLKMTPLVGASVHSVALCAISTGEISLLHDLFRDYAGLLVEGFPIWEGQSCSSTDRDIISWWETSARRAATWKMPANCWGPMPTPTCSRVLSLRMQAGARVGRY